MIKPYGGRLVDLYVSDSEKKKQKKLSIDLESWTLTGRQLCDLEMILNGAFSPLEGFMSKKDYESVVEDMRLEDGTLWPMPITLDVDDEFKAKIKPGDKVALRDNEGALIAVLKVGNIWKPNKSHESEKVFGADDEAHPAVDYLKNKAGEWYVGGSLIGIEVPHHYDFRESRYTPEELRMRFEKLGWNRVVAFQTRNPMHRAHVELTMRAAREANANLLIHPVVGMTKPGDVDHFTRVRVYKRVLQRYPSSTAALSLLPLAMRMGGPREALWHAIIRRNYGCTHFIVGRDHAGPGKNSKGEDFYGHYDAQELVDKYSDEIGITMVPFKLMLYVPNRDEYEPIDEIQKNTETRSLSGTELRYLLKTGKELPHWFTFPEVAEELQESHPPINEKGFVVLFTGLSGSGKSTLAKGLQAKLLEQGGRKVTLLDGDEVRQHLSSELGFSKEHRDLNVRRIGYVASEIAKHGGIAICSPIAPYARIRQELKSLSEERGGGFVLVHVATPLEVCEARDRKGLYAAARAGKIKNFTGISDPYEEPDNPDIRVNSSGVSPEELVQKILLEIESKYLSYKNE